MPRFRTTLSLLLACIACGLLLWVLHRLPAPQRGRVGQGGEPGLLFPAALREVDYLMIERTGFRAELRRGPDGWILRHPLEARASQTAVQRLLDACERAPLRGRVRHHEIVLRELTPAAFGLLEPQARLVIAGPRARAELLLGDLTSASNELFCSFSRSDDVLLTDPALIAALPESPFAMSDPRFFRADLRRVSAIGLRRPGGAYIKLVHGAAGWTLTQPVSARADAAAVAALLDTLTEAEIARYIWPTADDAPPDSLRDTRGRLLRYGLDDDASGAQIQVWMAGDPVGQHIRLGHPVEGLPGHVHALTPDGLAIVAVTNRLYEAARQPLDALRDKRLFTVGEADIQHLSVHGFGEPFSLRRDASGDWALTSPVSEQAERDPVARLVDALLALRADGFSEAPPMNSRTGEIARIDLATRHETWRLLRFPAEDDGVEAAVVPLVFHGEPLAFLVPTTQWNSVAGHLRNPVVLRNRMLFKLSADSIRRLAVRRDGASNRVESVEHDRHAGVWRSGLPDRSVNRVALDAWLAVLAEVRATRVESLEPVRDAARYGLANPYLEILVDLTTEETLRRVLLIGELTDGGGRFASLKGHDTVFVLAPETWRPLEQSLLQPAAQSVPAVEPVLPPSKEPE